MVAMISLEFLTQDNSITGIDGTKTTRRALIGELINNHNDEVSLLYAQALGQKTFVDYMNQKAKALGLTNTTFISVEDPAMTTEEDYAKFVNYIDTYKTYLRKVGGSTTTTR
jgi:D-alanyl-D-alanine carboxypeptidase